jgi:hypothetical protein
MPARIRIMFRNSEFIIRNSPKQIPVYWIRIGNTPEQIWITFRNKLGSGSGTHKLEKNFDYVQNNWIRIGEQARKIRITFKNCETRG